MKVPKPNPNPTGKHGKPFTLAPHSFEERYERFSPLHQSLARQGRKASEEEASEETMMSRRTIRIVALLLVILIGSATTVFTYDVISGRSITDAFPRPSPGCYG